MIIMMGSTATPTAQAIVVTTGCLANRAARIDAIRMIPEQTSEAYSMGCPATRDVGRPIVPRRPGARLSFLSVRFGGRRIRFFLRGSDLRGKQ